MKTKSTIPVSVTAINPTTEVIGELQDKIRRRAYELYEQRGRNDGYELDDWLQAESEITRTTTTSTAA